MEERVSPDHPMERLRELATAAKRRGLGGLTWLEIITPIEEALAWWDSEGKHLIKSSLMRYFPDERPTVGEFERSMAPHLPNRASNLATSWLLSHGALRPDPLDPMAMERLREVLREALDKGPTGHGLELDRRRAEEEDVDE